MTNLKVFAEGPMTLEDCFKTWANLGEQATGIAAAAANRASRKAGKKAA